nr:helitron helicase-like domain-containing protein [Tanacetum cinerariifolium]
MVVHIWKVTVSAHVTIAGLDFGMVKGSKDMETLNDPNTTSAAEEMFAMTYFRPHVDDSVNKGRGPYIFKISGQIYHWIGAMFPPSGDASRFLQLYIYDTEHEVPIGYDILAWLKVMV